MNLDDLIATAQPRTEVVRICARGDLVAAHAEAMRALDEATRADDALSGSPAVDEALARVREVEAEQDAATMEFTVTAVPRKVWADLLAAHPPSKEQRRAGHVYNPDSFSIGLVTACVTDPEMSEDQAQKLTEVLHAAEWNKLENTAFRLNTTATPAPKLPAATALVRANGQSSTTPRSEESPEAGSLAGSGEQ